MQTPSTLNELVAYEVFIHETGLRGNAARIAWAAKPIPKPKPLWDTSRDVAAECKQSHRDVNAMRDARGLPPLPGNGWDICPTCGNNVIIADLRDERSRKEFWISKICMNCQDTLFPSFKK